MGGTERARALGKILDCGIAIVDKRRPSPGKSQVMNIVGNVKNKTCIIVDDIIDSGGTIVNSAKILMERGAKEVHVYVTHGVLSGEAIKKINKNIFLCPLTSCLFASINLPTLEGFGIAIFPYLVYLMLFKKK